MLSFDTLAEITKGEVILNQHAGDVLHLITDSRKTAFPKGSLFFAVAGEHHDGHDYIQEIYAKGVRQFIVERNIDLNKFPAANIIKVNSSLNALQAIAIRHRHRYNIPVVGVTGSNGKTITKEWLYQLLAPYKRVVKNPHSYNSQLGVPLSVWQLNTQHQIGLFEAGISQRGEMERLAAVIQPTIGIFTNIGPAHDEGFSSREEKIAEKAILFAHVPIVIYCKDHLLIDQQFEKKGFTWGRHADSDVRIVTLQSVGTKTTIDLAYNNTSFHFTLPFSDSASLENVLHCITFLLYEKYSETVIQEGLHKLQPVKMRLEMKQAINGSYLIDDSYNNDLAGLQIALDFLTNQKQARRKTLVLSDMLQTGIVNEKLYEQISKMVALAKIDRFIGIGQNMTKHQSLFPDNAFFYKDTESFLSSVNKNDFGNEIILVKGARIYAFEHIVQLLEAKIHGTVLEIDLDALTHNLNFYRAKLNPETKLMVMVKAFAYGSGSVEIANLLQFHRVDCLGVAYADEGVNLRENGIYLPIMVMNPGEESFETFLQYQLDPEIYTLDMLRSLIHFLGDKPMAIHIKLDTGMRRLGFEAEDLPSLISLLKANQNITVKSIFSHLAGSDENFHDTFSKQQADVFNEMSIAIMKALHISPLRHLLNSSGIIRFPDYHFDMVRLGIGLYGIEPTNTHQKELRPISRLKTVISQIKEVKKGESVGYSRKGLADKNIRIATIAIGYADGFSRAFSNGVGSVWIQGKKAPVIGNVCMDMTMIDITEIDAKEGEEVEVFGKNLTISEMAGEINTIPYEILTSVSQRVKRVYYTE